MTSELAGLGRLRQWDENNHRYLMPKKIVPSSVRRKLWNVPDVLDQGETPQCVGYAGYQWLRSGPVTNRPPFTPTDLYGWAQDNDEWPGRDYDGSSTLGLMKALKAKGYIKDYVWALDAETLVAWILTTGPVVVGTNWFMEMFKPMNDGFLDVSGENAGGHEWTIVGADRDKMCPDRSKGAVRMVNSWGPSWGPQKGRAWMSFADLDRLIKDNGEAVTATEIKLAA